MKLTQWGLLLNFVGSATVGLIAYFGTISGFGGGVGLKSPWMEWVFWIGWGLLTMGFLLQLWASWSFSDGKIQAARTDSLLVLGWSKRQWILFLLVLFAFIVLALVGLAIGMPDSRINNWLLLLSGIVVLLYTVETQGLRLEMVRQNEMHILPLVIATIEERQDRVTRTSMPCLVLKNIGWGPALYVEVKEIEFEKEAGSRSVARFQPIDYLEPGKDSVIDAKWHVEFEDGDGREESFVVHLNPRSANKTHLVIIDYKNLNMRQHESVMRMGKGGIRLLGHGKESS